MITIREIVTDSLRYWEPRRVIYNGVLAVVTLFAFFQLLPQPLQTLSAPAALSLFTLAVIANLLYCVAYIPDVFVQLSGFREVWLKWRWTVFAIGLLLAAVLALTTVQLIFVPLM